MGIHSRGSSPATLSTPATLLIEIDGTNAGSSPALALIVSNVTIRGLVINRFSNTAIDPESGDIIVGNYIGTDVTGMTALGNGGSGIWINTRPNVVIGGTTPAARNVISGNGGNGIQIFNGAPGTIIQGNYFGTNATGTAAIPNAYSNIGLSGAFNTQIGGTVSGAGNLISGSGDSGIFIGFGSTGTLVQGNYIGTDVTGTLALGNYRNSIQIWDASTNTIGGTTAAARNVISGNTDSGIKIENGSTDTLVQGNYIGTNAAGTATLGNGSATIPGNSAGVVIDDNSANNTIGGIVAGARNIISGNGTPGNWGVGGVAMMRSSSNLISGTTVAARNIISGNDVGVVIYGNGLPSDPMTPSDSNIVQGNYIGTDVTGTVALGNLSNGINISNGVGNGVSNNIIGGTDPGARNVISGNGHAGISLSGGTLGNIIQGNYIGTDQSGLVALGNFDAGIAIASASNDNTIGGAGAGNLIANNSGHGVSISGGSIRNLVSRNRIFKNGNLGIKLFDPGTNNSQGYPILYGVVESGSNFNITGMLASTPNTVFALEFFSNAQCDSSSYGEGENYLGTQNVTTDGSGNVIFAASFPTDGNHIITATATDPQHNTSEFSACVSGPPPTAIATLTSTNTATFTATNTTTPTDTATTPTNTATYTNTATVTLSPTSTNTATFTNTPTATGTPTATITRTNTPTVTRTSTPTNTLTATRTSTNTSTATNTPTATATLTRTNTPTNTNTPVPRTDAIGVYKDGVFNLRFNNSTGSPDITAFFGGNMSDLPVAGDWNGDGMDTIGIYRGSTGVYFLSDSNTTPAVNYTLVFGNPGDTPFAGKWTTGATHDGVGVYRNSNGILYQKDALTTGFSDYFAVFGNPGDQGFGGDFDGNGFDSIGVYRSSNLTWYMTNNSQPSGITFSDIDFVWNIGTARAVIGDWNADGISTVGYLSSGGLFVLHSTNTAGGSNNSFAFGPSNGYPIAGKWSAAGKPNPVNVFVPGHSGSHTNANDQSSAD